MVLHLWWLIWKEFKKKLGGVPGEKGKEYSNFFLGGKKGFPIYELWNKKFYEFEGSLAKIQKRDRKRVLREIWVEPKGELKGN
jgi:hypothetical protein